jgi:hypothetical protein
MREDLQTYRRRKRQLKQKQQLQPLLCKRLTRKVHFGKQRGMEIVKINVKIHGKSYLHLT